MRAGTETILAQVVRIFGEAQPHNAYLFASRRGNRLKVLVHDGYGVWLSNRRLNQGRFPPRKPAPFLGVARKSVLEVSKSGLTETDKTTSGRRLQIRSKIEDPFLGQMHI